MTLTSRQQQILRLVAEGHTNAAIGRRLNITEQAAGSAVARLLAKLGARDRANLVHIAHQHRLLTHVECGTHNGYRRHQKRREPACTDCREAERIHSAIRRAQTRRAA
ncbi:response regulator transcription factor [Streptomyces kaniharaensis]|uniref:response regulator transcription factor n=1 Tax=Streptomyces kaniharaensis TaxID=212423 RepID=UPI0012961503|nr:LuxR C-terminal-related transcriptional regulator [Streptomyces kaniharaensis]